MKLTVCWTAIGRNKRFYHDICRKFGISDYMSINHETPCDIKEGLAQEVVVVLLA